MKSSSELMEVEALGSALRWELPVFDSAHARPPPTAQQLDELEAAAYQEGFARGQAEGYAAGHRKVQEEASRLRQLVEHMLRPLAHLDESTEQALVALAVEAARRLTREALDLQPERVLGVAREALAALPPHVRDVRVHAHPDDARFLQEQLTPPPETHHFRIVPDKDLARGDVRVQTEAAQVDARLDSRAAMLTQALTGEGA